MKAKNTIRESRSDWNQLKKMPESSIIFDDIPELNKSFFKDASLRVLRRKTSVSLRIDPDVLSWFKSDGKGYQTRINSVLRAYFEAHRR